MSKKNNKKSNYISRGKLEHALNIKNNRKDKETKPVQETKKEDVKKESVEVKANVNNKPANNKKSSKKKYKKGYINSEKLNLDDRVTVEDIIMEETKKDLGEITDKDLVIDNDLEKRRYRAMDAFKYNKVLTTLYTMDCDENDEKVIDNILELVMHCKDKDRKKCVSIVKKFNNSDKSKGELAKTLAQLCAVCKTDIQTLINRDGIELPDKEEDKNNTEAVEDNVETVEAEIVENNEEDLKEAVEPTKEELMQEIEMEAKMDIKTNEENKDASIGESNNTKESIDVKNKVNRSAKEIVNDAYKRALREFQINASTGDDFSLLRRMTVNGDNVYDAMKEIGINDCDFDEMAVALISGRLHYILSTRELLVYSNKYKNKDCCKKFIDLFVSKCKMGFPTDKKPGFEKVTIVG